MPEVEGKARSEQYIGHDQLFKQLLQAFFADFLRQFDPETASALDLNTVGFRDTEAFTDVPMGERRLLDIVAQVATKQGVDELILVHVEVQRKHEPDFPQRMWRYYSLLSLRENLPVIPIALTFYPASEGIAIATYERTALGRSILAFHYLQISLPRLEAAEYVKGGSVLGAALAGTMHLPAQRSAQIALHLAALRRVQQARLAGQIDEARAFLLVNLVATYLPLSRGERESLRVQLQQEGDTTMEATELTWADHVYLEGIEKGRLEGIEKGRRAMVVQLLRQRFGEIPDALEQRIEVAGEADLTRLLDRALTASRPDDLL